MACAGEVRGCSRALIRNRLKLIFLNWSFPRLNRKRMTSSGLSKHPPLAERKSARKVRLRQLWRTGDKHL